MIGKNTHSFMRIDNQRNIGANAFEQVPIPLIAIATINLWAAKNKLHTPKEARFTFPDRDITDDAADDALSETALPIPQPPVPFSEPDPILSVLEPATIRQPSARRITDYSKSPTTPEQFEIRGDTEVERDTEISILTAEEIL